MDSAHVSNNPSCCSKSTAAILLPPKISISNDSQHPQCLERRLSKACNCKACKCVRPRSRIVGKRRRGEVFQGGGRLACSIVRWIP
eukprot:scaffold1555_cov173-Amphora_coffeaeformis.AAC.22